MAAAYVSIFESGRVIVTHGSRPVLIFQNAPGLCAEMEAQGFDVEEVQELINEAAAKRNGISWDLMPETAA